MVKAIRVKKQLYVPVIYNDKLKNFMEERIIKYNTELWKMLMFHHVVVEPFPLNKPLSNNEIFRLVALLMTASSYEI